MCGDDDDLDHLDEELFDRFLGMADALGVSPDPGAKNTPSDLMDEKSRTRYLEGLFKAGLSRAVNDAHHLQHGEKMDVIAGQAIVFARLSGLLAGQFSADTNLFHSVITALMQGHDEASQMKETH